MEGGLWKENEMNNITIENIGKEQDKYLLSVDWKVI